MFLGALRYAVLMELQLKHCALTLLSAPHAAREEAAVLIAELALAGAVTVIDAGNRFDAYRLIEHLRLRLPDPMPAIRRVSIRRAFTCYQVGSLLESVAPGLQPVILLDLLATFHDENVPLPEAQRLLEGCLRRMECLARSGALLVTIAPPRSAGRACLVERLSAAARERYTLEAPAPRQVQPALF